MPANQATLQVDLNPGQLALLDRTLRDIPKGIQTVIPRAINKTSVTVRSRITKNIATDYNVTQKAVRDRITIKRAHQRQKFYFAVLRVTGRRIPLGAFSPRQGAKGTTVTIERGGDSKLYKRAFVHSTGSRSGGGKAVYTRIPEGGGSKADIDETTKLVPREPIHELWGPSVMSIFEKRYADNATRDAAQLLEKNIAQQVQVVLQKAGRPGSVDTFLGAMSERGGSD